MFWDLASAAHAILILPSQLIFSLTQPPTCGAEVALDDIMFRNCGLPGESHICWDVSWDLGGTGWGAKPRGALPLLSAPIVLGHHALARA